MAQPSIFDCLLAFVTARKYSVPDPWETLTEQETELFLRTYLNEISGRNPSAGLIHEPGDKGKTVGFAEPLVHVQNYHHDGDSRLGRMTALRFKQAKRIRTATKVNNYGCDSCKTTHPERFAVILPKRYSPIQAATTARGLETVVRFWITPLDWGQPACWASPSAEAETLHLITLGYHLWLTSMAVNHELRDTIGRTHSTWLLDLHEAIRGELDWLAVFKEAREGAGAAGDAITTAGSPHPVVFSSTGHTLRGILASIEDWSAEAERLREQARKGMQSLCKQVADIQQMCAVLKEDVAMLQDLETDGDGKPAFCWRCANGVGLLAERIGGSLVFVLEALEKDVDVLGSQDRCRVLRAGPDGRDEVPMSLSQISQAVRRGEAVVEWIQQSREQLKAWHKILRDVEHVYNMRRLADAVC